MPPDLLTMKKAQIQMGESVAVVVIVIILILLGIIFYSKLQQSSIADQQRLYEDLDAIELATVFMSLPETHCTQLQSSDINCVDLLKIEQFKELCNHPAEKLYYADLLKDADIHVVVVYPEQQDIEVYTTNTSGGTILPFLIPINIYDPVTKQTSFGYLNISKK